MIVNLYFLINNYCKICLILECHDHIRIQSFLNLIPYPDPDTNFSLFGSEFDPGSATLPAQTNHTNLNGAVRTAILLAFANIVVDYANRKGINI